jgi:hypothetical protein
VARAAVCRSSDTTSAFVMMMMMVCRLVRFRPRRSVTGAFTPES